MAPRTGPRRKHKRARADKPGKQIRKLVAMLNRGVLATAGLNHQEYTSELTLISREVEEAKAAQASPDSSVQKQCSTTSPTAMSTTCRVLHQIINEYLETSPEYLVHPQFWPRMRDSAVTKDAPAARETDGKQWPEDVMASMAEFARLTGKDRDRRHQAMFLIRHAITQRQQKAEVAAAEDEGITAEDVVDASRMWQATRATD